MNTLLVLSVCGLGMLVILFFALRAEWLNSEMEMVFWGEDVGEFERLPSFHVMLLRFWVWDVERFKKGSVKRPPSQAMEDRV